MLWTITKLLFAPSNIPKIIIWFFNLLFTLFYMRFHSFNLLPIIGIWYKKKNKNKTSVIKSITLLLTVASAKSFEFEGLVNIKISDIEFYLIVRSFSCLN